MDLNSLSDDMVACILKYTDFVTVNQLRRTNCRINNVSKTYENGIRFPVATIRLSYGEYRDNTSWKYEIDLSSNAVNCYADLVERNVFEIYKQFNKDDGSYIDIIDRLLKKVDLTGTLHFPSFSLIVNYQVLEVLWRNQKSLRHMRKLILCDTVTDCSESSVETFMSSCKQLKEFYITSSEGNMDVFCRTKLFEDRKWDNVSLRCYSTDSQSKCFVLNDEFLLKAVKNCKRLMIDFGETRRTSFTVDGVIDMVKALINEESITEHLSLGLIYTQNPSLDETEQRIRAIHSGLTCIFAKRFYTRFEDGLRKEILIIDCTIRRLKEPEVDFIRFSSCHTTNQEIEDTDELFCNYGPFD